jgi:hypothetical protein
MQRQMQKIFNRKTQRGEFNEIKIILIREAAEKQLEN